MKVVAGNRCWQCIREVEANIASGKWMDAEPVLKPWYETFLAENAFLKRVFSELKPKTVLEIGAGSGRIVEVVLNNSNASVVAFEKDAEMYELVRKRFEGNKRVEIIHTGKNFPTGKKFDLVLCMGGTFGNQEKETEILEYALSVSSRVIFTAYKKGSEENRRKIYESRGHKNLILKNNCFHFQDNWVKGLFSKSYSKKDLEKICSKPGKTKIHNLNKIAFIVEIGK